jgi:hypothetical protein
MSRRRVSSALGREVVVERAPARDAEPVVASAVSVVTA